jgi:hypothetical protein
VSLQAGRIASRILTRAKRGCCMNICTQQPGRTFALLHPGFNPGPPTKTELAFTTVRVGNVTGPLPAEGRLRVPALAAAIYPRIARPAWAISMSWV